MFRLSEKQKHQRNGCNLHDRCTLWQLRGWTENWTPNVELFVPRFSTAIDILSFGWWNCFLLLLPHTKPLITRNLFNKQNCHLKSIFYWFPLSITVVRRQPFMRAMCAIETFYSKLFEKLPIEIYFIPRLNFVVNYRPSTSRPLMRVMCVRVTFELKII